MPLQILSVQDLEIKDYSVLKNLPLMSVRMDFDPIWDSGILDQLSNVQQLNDHPIAYDKRPELTGEMMIERVSDFTKTCVVASKNHD